MSEGQSRSVLMPIESLTGEEQPDLWLERTRRKLLFRSHSAMHKAIAEATGLKYDCVHKALGSKRKARRIQADIKRCLDGWLETAEKGGELDIDDSYRGVPLEDVQALLPALLRKFQTKEHLCSFMSRETGLRIGSVRRYFQTGGQLRYAPVTIYKWARRLAEDGAPLKRGNSYLADQRTRQVASEIARRANEALTRWQSEQDEEYEIEYRYLRRALIAIIKEQRVSAPAYL